MESVDIREFRKANGMTQKALADYLGITQAFVSNMEAGRDTIPDKYIRKILNDPNVDSSMFAQDEKTGNVQNSNKDDVKVPREVFDKISQLIDANCSQRVDISNLIETVKSQQQTIDRLTAAESKIGARPAGDAGCADVG